MRRFGEERMEKISGTMNRIMQSGQIDSLEMGIFSKTIENTQKRVESHNFDIRKNVIKYDDVMNQMREIIYGQRRQVLMGADIHNEVMTMRNDVIDSMVDFYCPPKHKQDTWNYGGLAHEYGQTFGIGNAEQMIGRLGTKHDEIKKALTDTADKVYDIIAEKMKENDADIGEYERRCLLVSVDSHWADHIDAMDQLREGIGLRAMGNQDPVIQYRNEGFDMFDQMNAEIRQETVQRLYHPVFRAPLREQKPREMITNHGEGASTEKKKPKLVDKKPGPNDPCPCGSGKKYKKCCGRTAD